MDPPTDHVFCVLPVLNSWPRGDRQAGRQAGRPAVRCPLGFYPHRALPRLAPTVYLFFLYESVTAWESESQRIFI